MMSAPKEFDLAGRRGRILARTWRTDGPRRIVVIAHGYGEHAGRYDHVARYLVRRGASVYAPDHLGHGRSAGERALVEDFGDVVHDLHAVAERARADHPSLPIALIGHSMGGLIATRYAQTYPGELRALVLSGPAIGGKPLIEALLEIDPLPATPIDPGLLSRDPEVGRAYQDDPLVWHGPFKRPTLQALFAAIGEVAAGPRLGSLPTLWVHGADDGLTPLVETRKAIDGIRGEHLEEIIYPGARHEVFNETNRDEVLDAVASFLERTAR